MAVFKPNSKVPKFFPCDCSSVPETFVSVLLDIPAIQLSWGFPCKTLVMKLFEASLKILSQVFRVIVLFWSIMSFFEPDCMFLCNDCDIFSPYHNFPMPLSLPLYIYFRGFMDCFFVSGNCQILSGFAIAHLDDIL